SAADEDKQNEGNDEALDHERSLGRCLVWMAVHAGSQPCTETPARNAGSGSRHLLYRLDGLVNRGWPNIWGGMATVRRTNSREKILAAAADVARMSGPGNVSLEAVASRAGVSKGGLLYNFPSKGKLMQALVERYLGEFEQSLIEAHAGGESLLEAFVKRSVRECQESEPSSASWVFSAIAEDPDFLIPMKAFHRQLFARLKGDTNDLR